MKETTRSAIAAVLAADETVTKEQTEAAIGILTGRTRPERGEGAPPRDRIMKRREVADLFGVTTKTVDWMARQPGSILRKVYTASGCSRACGYSEASVREAIGAAGAADGKYPAAIPAD